MIKLSRCGHTLCLECLLKLQKNECPYCRDKFNEIINTIKLNINTNIVNNTFTSEYEDYFAADSLNYYGNDWDY